MPSEPHIGFLFCGLFQQSKIQAKANIHCRFTNDRNAIFSYTVTHFAVIEVRKQMMDKRRWLYWVYERIEATCEVSTS